VKTGFINGIKKHYHNFIQDLIYDVAFSPSPSPKIVNVVLTLDNSKLTEMMETYAANQRQPATLLLIMQEKLRRQQDISNCEDLFIKIMGLHNYNINSVQVFLDIINKDYDYIINKLFESENFAFSSIVKYMALVATSNTPKLQKIVPIFIEKYNRYDHIYFEVARNIIAQDNKYTKDLLNIPNQQLRHFEKHLLKHSINNPTAIHNYCAYLISRNVHLFFAFERDLLSRGNATQLVNYATAVSFSTKRLVLRRLIELKDEKCLIDFISKVPEYRKLLPML
jgi:hypothetical protein